MCVFPYVVDVVDDVDVVDVVKAFGSVEKHLFSLRTDMDPPPASKKQKRQYQTSSTCLIFLCPFYSVDICTNAIQYYMKKTVFMQ